VIVWVFAGGGESEISGLLPYLRREFPNCKFELCTPIRNKPGAKPRHEASPQGYTGKSLLEKIKERLLEKFNFKDSCDLIIIFDDLDYPLAEADDLDFANQKHQIFEHFISQLWRNYPELKPINHVIGFAKPELESWVIADWDRTVAKDPEFREKCKAMKYWLSNEHQVKFDSPEEFGLNPIFPQSYHKKLSDAIIEASEQQVGSRYSKQLHTARFIKQLDSAIAQQKCPEFRKFFISLSKFYNQI